MILGGVLGGAVSRSIWARILHLRRPIYTEALDATTTPLRSSPELHPDPAEGEQDSDPVVHFSKTLNWILRHSAVKMNVPIQPNGFVRHDHIKNCPRFSGMPSEEFDRALEMAGGLFQHVLERDERTGVQMWWMRARHKHSIPSIDTRLRRVRSVKELPHLAGTTSLENWKFIQTFGLQKSPADNFLHLIPTRAPRKLSQSLAGSADVCIYVDVAKILAAGIQLHIHSSQKFVLTTGDDSGRLPPEFFHQVHRLHYRHETLLAEARRALRRIRRGHILLRNAGRPRGASMASLPAHHSATLGL
ncbi:unnamed protein product [Mycena citricolor]|uniref:2'-phosphotransferase n=2 Tax=Mycena citricolor TaxID=2018698 RepID=A0AAD2JXI9_9AGAR|nr:unnamed protein product [Mycena citricolor]